MYGSFVNYVAFYLQKEIKVIVDTFVPDLTGDIIETRNLFENGIKVCHPYLPPLANELLWLNSLKERLKVLHFKFNMNLSSWLKITSRELNCIMLP